MESSGEVGQVNISEATYALVRDVGVGSLPAPGPDPGSDVSSQAALHGGTSDAPTAQSAMRRPGSTATDNQQLTTGPAFVFTPRGKVQAKGKGEMEMYFVRHS